jgi:hypothetical protein
LRHVEITVAVLVGSGSYVAVAQKRAVTFWYPRSAVAGVDW